MRSDAATVEDYLAELPEERRQVVARVRKVVLENLPEGFEEAMNWGMIAYEVPLERYPDTYNGKPLMYAALAAQKHAYSLYLSAPYMKGDDEGLAAGFERAGKKLDMGKSCVRFRRLDDLPLDVIGSVIGGTGLDDFIAIYEAGRGR